MAPGGGANPTTAAGMLQLDTSFLVDLAAEYSAKKIGTARLFLAAHAEKAVGVSVIALGEFAEGYDNRGDVEKFIVPFTVLAFSRAIAYKGAAVQRALKGRRLGENDLWVAATALEYEAELVGRDAAFKRVPRLKYTELPKK